MARQSLRALGATVSAALFTISSADAAVITSVEIQEPGFQYSDGSILENLDVTVGSDVAARYELLDFYTDDFLGTTYVFVTEQITLWFGESAEKMAGDGIRFEFETEYGCSIGSCPEDFSLPTAEAVESGGATLSNRQWDLGSIFLGTFAGTIDEATGDINDLSGLAILSFPDGGRFFGPQVDIEFGEAVAPVPLPGAAALFVSGLGVAGVRRLRRG